MFLSFCQSYIINARDIVFITWGALQKRHIGSSVYYINLTNHKTKIAKQNCVFGCIGSLRDEVISISLTAAAVAAPSVIHVDLPYGRDVNGVWKAPKFFWVRIALEYEG